MAGKKKVGICMFIFLNANHTFNGIGNCNGHIGARWLMQKGVK